MSGGSGDAARESLFPFGFRGPIERVCNRLLPLPDYCGDFASRTLIPGVRLVCVGDRRYVEVNRFGVWRRV